MTFEPGRSLAALTKDLNDTTRDAISRVVLTRLLSLESDYVSATTLALLKGYLQIAEIAREIAPLAVEADEVSAARWRSAD